MKGKLLVRSAVCLLVIFACSGASHASMVHVSITGSVSTPGSALPLAGDSFSVDFTMPLMPENSAPAGINAVSTGVDLQYVSGALSRDMPANAAWFSYDHGYSGVDLWLPYFNGSDDFFQIIVTFDPFESGFTGPVDAPTMKLVTYSGLAGIAYYIPDISLPDSVESALYDVTYSTSAVPIPAAAWFFGSALFGLVGLKRRKPRRLALCTGTV